MTIEYLSLFVSWVDSLSLQLHHFLHNSIVSYPNAEMDKRFFKSWVLHIPHCLRDLLWMMRAWSSVAPTFSSRASSSYEFFSRSLLKLITSFWHTFLTWMDPTILGGHSRWPSQLLHSSLLLLPLQVVLWFGRLCILDLHILQLVSLGHILIFVLPFN